MGLYEELMECCETEEQRHYLRKTFFEPMERVVAAIRRSQDDGSANPITRKVQGPICAPFVSGTLDELLATGSLSQSRKMLLQDFSEVYSI